MSVTKTIELILTARNAATGVINGAVQMVRTASSRMISAFGGIYRTVFQLRNMVAGGFAYMAARAILRPAIETQTFETQWEVILGSAERAKKRMAELQEFAAFTPNLLPEIVRASMVLERLTKGALSTGAGLRLVGDVAAGVEPSIEEMATWFGRLYDGLQNNSPVGEALRRFQELGIITGDARREIERMQAANVDGAAIWQMVTGEMQAYDGMMGKLSDTVAGKASTAMDNFQAALRTIGEELLPVMTTALTKINDTLVKIQKNGDITLYIDEVVETNSMYYDWWTKFKDWGTTPTILDPKARERVLQERRIERGEATDRELAEKVWRGSGRPMENFAPWWEKQQSKKRDRQADQEQKKAAEEQAQREENARKRQEASAKAQQAQKAKQRDEAAKAEEKKRREEERQHRALLAQRRRQEAEKLALLRRQSQKTGDAMETAREREATIMERRRRNQARKEGLVWELTASASEKRAVRREERERQEGEDRLMNVVNRARKRRERGDSLNDMDQRALKWANERQSLNRAEDDVDRQLKELATKRNATLAAIETKIDKMVGLTA